MDILVCTLIKQVERIYTEATLSEMWLRQWWYQLTGRTWIDIANTVLTLNIWEEKTVINRTPKIKIQIEVIVDCIVVTKKKFL